MLGVQQQSATQPSDLLILYANRQAADRVVKLAFQLARANTELLSSEAELQQAAAPAESSSPRALQRDERDLEARKNSYSGGNCRHAAAGSRARSRGRWACRAASEGCRAAERARPRECAAQSAEQHAGARARDRCERLGSDRPQGDIDAIRRPSRGDTGVMPELAAADAKQARPESATPRRRHRGANRCAQVRPLGPRQRRPAAPEQALDDRRGRRPHGSASADIHRDSCDARAADQDAFRSRRRTRRAASRGRRGRAQDGTRRVRHDRLAVCTNVVDSRALDESRRAARAVPRQSRQLARRDADAVSNSSDDARGSRGLSFCCWPPCSWPASCGSAPCSTMCKSPGDGTSCCSCAESSCGRSRSRSSGSRSPRRRALSPRSPACLPPALPLRCRACWSRSSATSS